MRKIAFLPLPSPIVRLAGDGCVPVAERDGEHASLFASPIVRLAGYLCNGCKRSLIGEKYHEEFSSEFWKDWICPKSGAT
ncbi:unnamed protein product [Rhizophagus irregularis]|nr:unnamed protein product [Rhizophagus irregularis]